MQPKNITCIINASKYIIKITFSNDFFFISNALLANLMVGFSFLHILDCLGCQLLGNLPGRPSAQTWMDNIWCHSLESVWVTGSLMWKWPSDQDYFAHLNNIWARQSKRSTSPIGQPFCQSKNMPLKCANLSTDNIKMTHLQSYSPPTEILWKLRKQYLCKKFETECVYYRNM